MSSYLTSGGENCRGGFRQIDTGTVIVGVGSVVGGLATAVLVIQATARAPAQIVLSEPLARLLLPGVIVAGWVLIGALLLDGRALAVPLAGGALLGAAATNPVALGTTWIALGPAPVVDPMSYLVAVVAGVAFSSPPLGLSWLSAPLVGTTISVLLAVYVISKAVRDPTVQDEVRAVCQYHRL